MNREGLVLPGQVSVVVCADAAANWRNLCAAAASVRDQGPLPGEVIVAVDHNPDLAARCRWAFPGEVIVSNVGRRGPAATRNAGMEAATGAVVAFLDDDAVARPGWLAALAAGYGHSRVLVVGGAVVSRWSATGNAARSGAPESGPPWANMSLRRSVFLEVGGFSHGLVRAEAELGRRVLRRWPQAQFRVVPEAAVEVNRRPRGLRSVSPLGELGRLGGPVEVG
ncbi:MAG: glycosyltransferase family 2 protein [Acidimicrobiales bacterium]